MKRILVLLIVAALALAACGQQQDTKDLPADDGLPPEPVALPAEEETGPAEDGDEATVVIDDAAGEAFGGDSGIPMTGKVGEITCSLADRELTFTIANDGVQTWSLDQEAGFGEREFMNAKVFINNYEANKKTPYYGDEGERLFGPEEKLSANCGGVTMLEPGDQATCTLAPVPLFSEDSFQNKNRIWISVPNDDIDYVTFTCA